MAKCLGVQLKQRIRFPLFERLFCRISVLRGASRWGGGGGMLYVSRALRRTYTLFYPHPWFRLHVFKLKFLLLLLLFAFEQKCFQLRSL